MNGQPSLVIQVSAKSLGTPSLALDLDLQQDLVPWPPSVPPLLFYFFTILITTRNYLVFPGQAPQEQSLGVDS